MKPISPVSMYVTNSCNHTQCRHILHKTNSFGRMHFKIIRSLSYVEPQNVDFIHFKSVEYMSPREKIDKQIRPVLLGCLTSAML